MQYCIRVLWFHGMAGASIAKYLAVARPMVSSFIHRNVTDHRDEMSMESRQAMLTMLAGSRQDNDVLRPYHFIPLKLKQIQRKAAVNVPVVDNTRKARAEIKRRKKAALEAAEKAARDQKRREEGLATKRGISASALETMAQTGLLWDSAKQVNNLLKDKTSSAGRRLEAGMQFRHYREGSSIAAMGSVDYERPSGGGQGLPLAAYKLQCIHAMGAIRGMMVNAEFLALEAVVERDEFIWEGFPAGSQERSDAVERIKQALDIVAVYQGLMDRAGFAERWNRALPEVKDLSWEDAIELKRAAAGVLADGLRTG